jgi:hypothetical protein
MITNEFDDDIDLNDNNETIDFVFHGTLIDAKGVIVVLELAKAMPQNSFLIPYSKEEVRVNFPNQKLSENITFDSCTWNTGLKEWLFKSKIILCPSLWSAPIEGGVLKSLYFNGCVAVFDAKYSFGSELSEDVVIKITNNIEDTVTVLESFLTSNVKRQVFKENTKIWVKGFIKKNKEIFEKNIKEVFPD